MSIPIVWWLVLTATGYGAQAGASTTVFPVPFGSYEDCATAAAQYHAVEYSGRIGSCLQQRVSDVAIFYNPNRSTQWGAYPQQAPK